MSAFVAQLLLATLAPIVWQLIANVIGWSEGQITSLGNLGFQVLNGAFIGIAGLTLGVLVPLAFPKTVRTGVLVWALPSVIWILLVTWDLRDFGFRRTVLDFLYLEHPGADPGPLLRELSTYPAWSAVWYSVGMVIARRRRQERAPVDATQIV